MQSFNDTQVLIIDQLYQEKIVRNLAHNLFNKNGAQEKELYSAFNNWTSSQANHKPVN